ncbi:hypothetical protein MSG28_003886 [Choristoneura fumiferana]|uniref:Uncharacterized protein n=1 Tax=Choristoneura fumiferana TaxID=7141 RepID=A0ACC0KHA8_CHOFU|nr:hypothetical protein MSG28_003886 [Choristoneura fumiferana]
MKEIELTQFLVSFTGQIENVVFPAGVFDELLYIQYETVWGPDWSPVSGLTSGTSQMARSGNDPEKVVFNMPLEMVFSSTNVSGLLRTESYGTVEVKISMMSKDLRRLGYDNQPPACQQIHYT